jgi:hypothetical protein
LLGPVTLDDVGQVSLKAGIGGSVLRPIRQQCGLKGLALHDILEQCFQSFLAGQAFAAPIRFEQFRGFVIQGHVEHGFMVRGWFEAGQARKPRSDLERLEDRDGSRVRQKTVHEPLCYHFPMTRLLEQTLDTLEHLPTEELDALVTHALKVRASRNAPHLIQETRMLEQIHHAIPADVQARFDTLLEKRDALTNAEHSELLELTNTIENLDAKRVTLLGELARNRGVTLEQIMRESERVQ